jgi:hypothetical protein
VGPAGKITDQWQVKQFSDHMDTQGPEDFFLRLSLNESLIPDTWKRIRDFYFGKKEIPDPDDLIKVTKTPWSESASELYRPSDRCLSAKRLPTFADRGCHVVNVTDPYGRILGFLDRSRYFSIK